MAENPSRIYNLFITQKTNKIKAYTVKFYIQGQMKYVTIDDYFPCKTNNKLAFSSTNQKELWLSIIEKAWAKINNFCYMKTWLGLPSEALSALSEAPTIYENHKKYLKKNRIYDIWKKLIYGQKKKWIICANTEEVKNTEKMGLIKNHAYGIIGVYECDISVIENYEEFIKAFSNKYHYFQKDNLRLIKLRNPWGCKEWRGEFCNNSSLWNDNLKKKVYFHDDSLEGVFYMTFEDFTHYFPWSFICQIQDNYHYRYGKIRQSKEITVVKYMETKKEKRIDSSTKEEESFIIDAEKEIILYPFCCLFINVQTKTHCYLTLHQLQKRFINNYLKNKKELKTMIDNKYETPIAQIILTRYEESINYYKFIKGDFINWDKLILDVNLDPGEYHIFCRVYWRYPEIDCKLVLSTYSEYPLDIYELKYDNANIPCYNLYTNPNFLSPDNWLIQVLKQIALKSSKREYFSEKEKTSFFTYDIFENSIGYGLFYYENNSLEGIIKSIVQLEQLIGLRVLNFTPDNDGLYTLKIPPKKNQMLIFEILDLPWESTISWSHIKWFEYSAEYIIKNYLHDKEVCEKTEYESGDIVCSKISHEGGYLIYLENKSKYDYKCSLKFKELENLVVVDSSYLDNKMKLNITKNSIYYFEIKWIKKGLNHRLNLEKSFKKN